MPRNAWGGQFYWAVAGGSLAKLSSNVKSVAGIDISYSSSKITNLESANRFHEYIRGMGDGGEIPVKLILEEADVSATLAWLALSPDKFPMLFEVRLPLVSTQATRAKFAFSGHPIEIKNPDFDVDSDDPLYLDLKFKVTGLPTFTAGS